MRGLDAAFERLDQRKTYEANLELVTKGTNKRLALFAGDQKVEHLNDDFFGETKTGPIAPDDAGHSPVGASEHIADRDAVADLGTRRDREEQDGQCEQQRGHGSQRRSGRPPDVAPTHSSADSPP